MNRNFLTDAELAAMDLPLAMRAAACFSGLTDREIISRMGWEPRNGYRLLAPNDDYWPSVPSLPRLRNALPAQGHGRPLPAHGRLPLVPRAGW